MSQIQADQAYLLFEQNKAIFVDVRSKQKYKCKHIPRAVHIDFFQHNFEEKFNQLPVNKSIIIYCDIGFKTELVKIYLKNRRDITLYELEGGLLEWKKCNFPLEK